MNAIKYRVAQLKDILFNAFVAAESIIIYTSFQVINFDSPRGGVNIKTHSGEWTTSHLLIQRADIADSGNYTCAPSNAGRTSAKVHVFLHGKCLFTLGEIPSSDRKRRLNLRRIEITYIAMNKQIVPRVLRCKDESIQLVC